DQVAAFEKAVIRRGYYPFRTTPQGVLELHENEARWHGLFEDEMLKTVERWMQVANERLAGSGIRCFGGPGNDGRLHVDDVIRDAETVELAEGEVVEIDGYQMVSSGWANRTPWHTYREEDEEDLGIRIRKITDQLTAPPERTIFSLHCPPYRSGLD